MQFEKQKIGIKSLNLKNLKLKLTQKIAPPKSYREMEKESNKNMIGSFHQNFYKPKMSISKYKTSKNSRKHKT